MKTLINIFSALAFLIASEQSYSQHNVQLDDGAGHYSLITSATIGSSNTFVLPNSPGTLLTNVSAASTLWLTTGNTFSSGVDMTDNVFGTTAASTLKPVNIIANGVRVMRFDAAPTSNTTGGGTANSIAGVNPVANFIGGGNGCTITGGGYQFIGGGGSNQIFASTAGYNDDNAIVGGANNIINSASTGVSYSGLNVICGGLANYINTYTATNTQTGFSFIGGGYNSYASGGLGLNSGFNAVVGGYQNDASGGSATASGFNSVGGGQGNQAHGFSGPNSGYNVIAGGGINNANGFGPALNTGFNAILGGNVNDAHGGSALFSGFNTIGAGYQNNAAGSDGQYSGFNTIGGGQSNNTYGTATPFSGFNTVAGGYGNIASPSGANFGYIFVGGGEINQGTNLHAAVGGGFSNQATGNAASIFGGSTNIASGDGAFIGGGGFDGATTIGNVASAKASTIGGGIGNTASGAYSTISGGNKNTASGDYSSVGGGYQASASNYGQQAHSCGQFAVPGDAQGSFFIARNSYTGNQANQPLFLDGASMGMSIPVNTVWRYSILVSGIDVTTGDVFTTELSGAAKSTSLIGAVNTIGGANFTPAGTLATASATVVMAAGILQVQITQTTTNTIRWVAKVSTVEVGY